VLAVLAMALAAGGCSSLPSAGEAEAIDGTATGAPTTLPGEAVPGGSEGSRPASPSVRDGDNRDVDDLASELAGGAGGDAEWVAVLARLQALDWLAARYPGEYDVHEIFSEEWAADTAVPNQEESLAMGVYVERPLPSLVSVHKTGETGELVELEAVVESGEGRIRQVADDAVLGTLQGGPARGLFIVGQDGPAGQWRIHSIAELTLDGGATADPSAAEEQTP
jgi:hypothetical protein